MQTLLLITSKGNVIIQNETIVYTESYSNFLIDGGETLPESIQTIDYNVDNQTCYINGELQESFTNDYAERVISALPTINDNYLTRKKEEKEQADKEEAENAWEALTLEEYKKQRLGALNSLANTFEQNINNNMYFTSSLGFVVNGDRRTLENIQSLQAILPDDETTIQYRDYYNKAETVNRPQLKIMELELRQNGLSLYNQKWAYQDQIEDAQSKEELKAMEFPFTMMDFTPVQEDSGASIQDEEQDVVQTLATLLGNRV